MAYKKGQDRRQRVIFPDCIDEYVEADAPVRLFDAFVDSLKMDELGFVRSTPAETGTPGYDPRDLLKLYIYGYFYQVRSSRKLARECKCNIEVMWLLSKLTPDVAAYLAANAITAHPYAEAESWLRTLHGCCVLAEPGKTNYALSTALASGCRVLEAASPVALLKAVRNATEVAGLRQAMRRDGVALVRFLMWLEQAVPPGQATEVRAADELHRLRAAQPLFVGDSFDTITGYGPHGAIVHYEATPETDVPLRPQGLLLVDSGAQYLDGTTDVTRTIALGPLTDEEATDYTLVLKGHRRRPSFPKARVAHNSTCWHGCPCGEGV